MAGPIYTWVRRLALQADLAGADRVLRDALLDMTSSLSVSLVYPGDDGLWTLGGDDEIPREAAPIVAVAQARRAVIASHTALVPIVTSSETVAVILLTRNPRNPAYHPAEHIAMIAIARESAAILHHLAVQHLSRASEEKRDAGGLYRGEALQAHRARGNEGAPVNLSPVWIRRAYPFLVVTLLVAVVASIFITVPTYAEGPAVVVFEGTPVTAPAAGTVDQVLVQPGQAVVPGTVLVRLHSANEAAELEQATTAFDSATIGYLFDDTDEQVKKSLVAAFGQRELARARRRDPHRPRAQGRHRLGRAGAAGRAAPARRSHPVGRRAGHRARDDRVPARQGSAAAAPRHAAAGGADRLHQDARGRDDHQRRQRGDRRQRGRALHRRAARRLAEAARRQLRDRQGRAAEAHVRDDSTTLYFHHGMQAKTEVKLVDKPFLVTLLPALEKYIPE